MTTFVMGKFGVSTHKSTTGSIISIVGILLIVKTIESIAAELQGKFSCPLRVNVTDPKFLSVEPGM